MSADAQKLREEIKRMHGALNEINYYELLGVDPDAPGEAVTSAFRQLAKKWHIDRFSQAGLGEDERTMVQDIFAALNEAHRTLTDPQKREDYDYEHQDGPNVADILTAENMFLRGKNMLKTGGYKGAHEMFKAAHAGNPDEREYKAYLLYTEYLQIPKNENGQVTDKKRTTDICNELKAMGESIGDKDWILMFQGIVQLGLGNDKVALGLLRSASYANPQNHEVQRHLRLLEKRKNNPKSEGFFAKLFKKK